MMKEFWLEWRDQLMMLALAIPLILWTAEGLALRRENKVLVDQREALTVARNRCESYLEGAVLFIPEEDLKWWEEYKGRIDYGEGR